MTQISFFPKGNEIETQRVKLQGSVNVEPIYGKPCSEREMLHRIITFNTKDRDALMPFTHRVIQAINAGPNTVNSIRLFSIEYNDGVNRWNHICEEVIDLGDLPRLIREQSITKYSH